MTSALLYNVGHTAFVGAASYVFCREFNQHYAFEKAVLVTVLVGVRNLAGEAIRHQRNDNDHIPVTTALIVSANLLAIPCTLYAGQVLNFKAADYLLIFGLNSIGYGIDYGLSHLYQMLRTKGELIEEVAG
jgi:hypothetical protein